MLGHDENFGAAKTLDPSFQPEKPLNPLGLGSTSSRVGTGFGNGQEWNAGEHANVYDAVRENTGVVVEKMDPRVDFARSLADPALQSIASRVDFVANENEGTTHPETQAAFVSKHEEYGVSAQALRFRLQTRSGIVPLQCWWQLQSWMQCVDKTCLVLSLV